MMSRRSKALCRRVIYADKDLDDSVKLLEQYNIPMVVMCSQISADNICSVSTYAVEQNVEKSRSLVERARLEIA